MKKLQIIVIVLALGLFQSCYKPGDISVQNNISNARIIDVKWGNFYLAAELLPGESSEKLTIDRYQEKLPSKHKVTFKMVANDKLVYLETVEKYLLEEDDELHITLSDDTRVKNPNE